MHEVGALIEEPIIMWLEKPLLQHISKSYFNDKGVYLFSTQAGWILVIKSLFKLINFNPANISAYEFNSSQHFSQYI